MSDPRSDSRGSPEALERALAVINISVDHHRRSAAEEVIGKAVDCYWWYENGARSAPRSRQLKEKAKHLHDALGETLDTLSPDDKYLMSALFRLNPYARLHQRGFVESIKNLREDLEQLSSALWQLVHSPSPKGQGNLWSRFYAPSKAALTLECADIVSRFCPDILSGYADGPFVEFVGAVYEYATGEDPDAPRVGLERYVKYYGALFAKRRQTTDKFNASLLTDVDYSAEIDDFEEKIEEFGYL